MIHIAIVDDHHIVAEGFARLINMQSGMTITSILNSYDDTVKYLTNVTPDVMLVDISLPERSGIELMNYIHEHFPDIKLITLSMYDTEPYISDAFKAGACGYLSKRVASDELILAIERILEGKHYLSDDVAVNRLKNQKINDELNLTAREIEVFKLLAGSISIKRIAKILQMQPKTVHAHKANLSKKLNIQSSEEIRKTALQYNLISLEDLK